MLFKAKPSIKEPVELKFDTSTIKFVDSVKFLGVWIDQNLSWRVHTSKLILKIQKNSHLLFRTKKHLNLHAKKVLYYAQIYSHLTYGLSIWGPMAMKTDINKLESLQLKCLQCITSKYRTSFHSFKNLIKLELGKIWLENKVF